MVVTFITEKALSVAKVAHAKQKDRGGHPYIEHPITVADGMEDEMCGAAGLLHDSVEDGDISIEDLFAPPNSFPLPVVLAVQRLTHVPRDYPYMQYIRHLSYNHIAREVKSADLRHNMDLSRLGKEPTKKDLERVRKYQNALAFLHSSKAKLGASAPAHNGLFADIPTLGKLYFRDVYQWQNRPKVFSCVGPEEQMFLMLTLEERSAYDAQWAAIAIPFGMLRAIEKAEGEEQSNLINKAIHSKYVLAFTVSKTDSEWATAWTPTSGIKSL